MSRLLLLLSLPLLAVLFVDARDGLPSWIQCTSNLHCAPGYCCRMGFERFSAPTCDPLLKDGEFCKPGEPFMTNGTRTYPDGTSVELDDIYVMFCPCAIGLACDRQAHVCRDASEMKDFNHLGGSSDKTED